uniref:Uncharacterized protein n=1 Tax=Candidatus Methanogaster sp. ANME-2c ERB4 TaxID=2759911 RepID=A0A7G9YJ62_9EURY|nr:hypothetical protein IDMEPGOH_00002 [Methanosarcinales archaeon ANME-2c ERB4]
MGGVGAVVEIKASRDFTLDEYGVLCESMLSGGYMAYDIYNHLSKTTDNERICSHLHQQDAESLHRAAHW